MCNALPSLKNKKDENLSLIYSRGARRVKNKNYRQGAKVILVGCGKPFTKKLEYFLGVLLARLHHLLAGRFFHSFRRDHCVRLGEPSARRVAAR